MEWATSQPASPFAVAVLEKKDQDWVLHHANRFFHEWYGVDEASAKGLPLPPLKDWEELLAAPPETGQARSRDLQESGSSWKRATIQRDSESMLVLMIQDISKEKNSQAELESFFDVNLDLLSIADTDARFVKLNPEWSKVLGYSTAELIGRSYFDFVHPEDIASTLRAQEELKGGKAVIKFINRYQAKDGSYRFLEWRSHPGGNLVHAAARDITEWVEAQHSLMRGDHVLHELSRQVPGVIYQYQYFPDGRSCFPFASEHIWDVYEVLPEEVASDASKVLSRVLPEDYQRVVEKIIESYETLCDWEDEYRVLLPEKGLRWLHGLARPEKLPDGSVMWHGYISDITERRNEEAVFKDQALYIEKVLESLPDLVFVMDHKGVYLDARAGSAEALYVPKEIIKGQSLENLLPPETAAVIMESIRSVAEGNGPTTRDYSLTIGGEKKYFKARLSAFDSERILALVEDTTATRSMERRLAQSERNFRQFFDTLGDMVFIGDRQGRIFAVNQAVVEKLGYSEEELLSMHILDVHPREKRSEAEAVYGEMFAGKRHSCPLPLQSKAGRMIPVETRIWFGAWDGKDCIFGISKDLSAEQEALQKFDKIFQVNPALMAVSDTEDQRFVQVNQAFLATLGYTMEEVVGRTSEDLNLFPDPGRQREVARMLQENGHIRNVELLVRTKDGRTMEGLFSGELIESQGKVYFLTVMTDITAQKHAQEKALVASRAKSEFLANMSHELRTPLNGIIGFTDLLARTQLSPEQREYLKIVKDSGHSLLGLISDILDFSKIEAGKLELEAVRGDFYEVLEAALDIVKVQAFSKGMEVVLDLDPDLPRFGTFDPVRVKQILVNLLGNAVKFTERGEVVLAVGFASGPGSRGRARIEVRDTGIGIREDQRDRLFRAFSQADSSTTRQFGGTGLGLIISNLLAEKMGSRIDLESVWGEGSTFGWTLDTVWESMPQPASLAFSNILLVDDNPASLHAMEKLLKAWDCEVREAQDGLSALDELREGREIQAIVADYNMPYLDGLAMFRMLRQKLEVPEEQVAAILLLSPDETPPKPEDLSRLGIRQVLTKPVKPSELRCALSECSKQITGNGTEGDAEYPGENPDQRRSVIAIAEDVPMNMLLTKKLIQQHYPQARLVEAANGAEVFQLVQNQHVDLVLMDVQMPVMDGLEATQLIRQYEQRSGYRVPIVALTAGALKEERERCLSAGMDDFLSKPLSSEALWRCLAKYFFMAETAGPQMEETVGQTEPLPTFSREELLERTGDNLDLMHELLIAFKEMELRLGTLQSAIENRDASLLTRLAHSVKGAAMNMSFPKLGHLAASLEKQADDSEAAARLLPLIRQEWLQVAAAIDKELEG